MLEDGLPIPSQIRVPVHIAHNKATRVQICVCLSQAWQWPVQIVIKRYVSVSYFRITSFDKSFFRAQITLVCARQYAHSVSACACKEPNTLTRTQRLALPLACGYNWALAVDRWNALINCLELRPEAQER